MDKVLTREEAAAHIKMSPRNLNRFMAARLVPFIKTHFSKDPIRGRVYFSKKKLDEWQDRDEDLEAMTDLEKESWKLKQQTNISIERGKEADEEFLALQIIKLSRTLRACLDEGKEPNLSRDERKKLEEHSGDFEEYFTLIPQLHELEKKRLIEFFDGDMECLFKHFPKMFEQEIKAGKQVEQAEVKEMRGGIPIDRIQTLPGTLKPKKRSVQVEQSEASELTKKVDN